MTALAVIWIGGIPVCWLLSLAAAFSESAYAGPRPVVKALLRRCAYGVVWPVWLIVYLAGSLGEDEW